LAQPIVLIAKNDLNYLALYSAVLRNLPCSLVTARSNEDVLRIFEEGIPAVTVFDIMMDPTSLDIWSLIQDRSRFPAAKFVLVVDNPMSNDAPSALTESGQVKPICLKELKTAVSQALASVES
jgi:CheY-like chemotaxis protein